MNAGGQTKFTPIDRRIGRFDWRQFHVANDTVDVAGMDRRRRFDRFAAVLAIAPMLLSALLVLAYL